MGTGQLARIAHYNEAETRWWQGFVQQHPDKGGSPWLPKLS